MGIHLSTMIPLIEVSSDYHRIDSVQLRFVEDVLAESILAQLLLVVERMKTRTSKVWKTIRREP
jgi:hypothetical protein